MADLTTVDGIINYYVNLLIIQYNNKPKARATIYSIIEKLIASAILLDIKEAFNVDTAIGVQLDVLGKYVDLDRFYAGQDLTGFFALTTYTDPPSPAGKIGLTTYTLGFSKPGKTLIYPDVLSGTLSLDDDDFRFLIKLRIFQNNINFSHGAIDNVLFNFFGDQLIADSPGNMVMYYFAQFGLGAIIIVALQKDLLPRPMGVRLALIEQVRPFFGLATYSGYSSKIVGLTSYSNPAIPVGQTLTYDDVTFEVSNG